MIRVRVRWIWKDLCAGNYEPLEKVKIRWWRLTVRYLRVIHRFVYSCLASIDLLIQGECLVFEYAC
jgi:hypothetical protein